MSIAPGWYPDPADPAHTRYWDGEGWADQPVPTTADLRAAEAAKAAAEQAARDQAAMLPSPYPVTKPGRLPPPLRGEAPPWWPENIAFPPVLPVRPHGLALASPGRRMAARSIDLAALVLLNLVFNGYFMYQWLQESIPFVQSWLATGEIDSSVAGHLNELLLIISLIAYALWFAYEVPVTHTRGQTLGKMLTGIRVVPMEGLQRLPFRRCFRRWHWFGLPFLLFICCGIFGFVLPFIDNLFVSTDRYLHLAWHDRTARTFVVRVPPRNAPLS
jgi:uncharacterized RDD family membrane protein YckC